MRVLAALVAVVLCAGCGGPEGLDAASRATSEPQSMAAVPAAQSGHIDAAAVARARSALPAGYEVADLSGPAAPLNLWGLGSKWSATPDACGALADAGVEGGDERPLAGWSASGPGGIVYAAVAQGPPGPGPTIDESCAQWSISGGSSDGSVSYLPAPAIEDAVTVGLATEVTTRVEGGTETHSHAETFTAHLSDYVAYVVVVTDPGSSGVPLAPGFASNLLVAVVSAIRR